MLLLQPSGFHALGFSFPCAEGAWGQSSVHGLCPLIGVSETRSPLPCSSWECPAIRNESVCGGWGVGGSSVKEGSVLHFQWEPENILALTFFKSIAGPEAL